MKSKIIVILVLIIMLSGLVVYEEAMVNTSMDIIYEKAVVLQAETADTEYINTTSVLSQAESIYDIWCDYEIKLCFLANHKSIQDMGVQLTNLKSYIITNDIEDYKQTIALIVYYSSLFRHIMGASLDSIF